MDNVTTSSPAGIGTTLLRRSQAAHYVETRYNFPCSPRWLAKLAVVGGGPPFRKAGRTPLYDETDLDSWATQRLGTAQATTSDHKRSKVTDSSLMSSQRGTADDEH